MPVETRDDARNIARLFQAKPTPSLATTTFSLVLSFRRSPPLSRMDPDLRVFEFCPASVFAPHGLSGGEIGPQPKGDLRHPRVPRP